MTTASNPAAAVLRPKRQARYLIILTALPLLFPLLPLGLASFVVPQLRIAAVTVLLLEAAAVAYAVLWVRRMRFESADGRYLWQSEFSTRRFGPEDVATVIPVNTIDFGLQGASFLFIVGRQTRLLARLDTTAYERPDLEAVVNDLAARGAVVEPVRTPMTPGQFGRLHPGLLRWNETHRVAFMLLVMLGAFVLLIPVAVLTVLSFIG